MSSDPTTAFSGGPSSALQLQTVDISDRPLRLVVTGEVDSCSSEQLRQAVTRIVGGSAPAILQIDASGISFLDSSGIRCLLTCRADAEAAGTRLVLVNASPVVAQILEITDLLKLFGLPEPPAPTVRRHGRSHDAAPMQDLLDRSAAIRREAQETRKRAEAKRRDDVGSWGALPRLK